MQAQAISTKSSLTDTSHRYPRTALGLRPETNFCLSLTIGIVSSQGQYVLRTSLWLRSPKCFSNNTLFVTSSRHYIILQQIAVCKQILHLPSCVSRSNKAHNHFISSQDHCARWSVPPNDCTATSNLCHGAPKRLRQACTASYICVQLPTTPINELYALFVDPFPLSHWSNNDRQSFCASIQCS